DVRVGAGRESNVGRYGLRHAGEIYRAFSALRLRSFRLLKERAGGERGGAPVEGDGDGTEEEGDRHRDEGRGSGGDLEIDRDADERHRADERGEEVELTRFEDQRFLACEHVAQEAAAYGVHHPDENG